MFYRLIYSIIIALTHIILHQHTLHTNKHSMNGSYYNIIITCSISKILSHHFKHFAPESDMETDTQWTQNKNFRNKQMSKCISQ